MNKIQKIESRLLRVIKRCLRNWKRKQKKKQVRKSRKRVRTRREIQTRKTSGKVAQRKPGKTGSQHRQSQARRKNERKIQEKRRQFILKTAAFAAVGVLSAAGVFLVKKLTIQAEASSAKSVETVVEKAQEENTRQYMYGIESIISGVCISQDTDSEVNKLGTSCEAVLVGQRVGKNQQESNLDFSKAAADTVEKLENHSGKMSLLALRPADAAETSVAWKMAMENTSTPTALILSRQNITDLPGTDRYDEALQAEKGAYVVCKTGENPDVVLVASGSEVSTFTTTRLFP